jgi:hypothetical protein
MTFEPGGLIREPPEKKFYTVPEFIVSHSISRARLYAEINSGRLIARKMGSRTLIDGDSPGSSGRRNTSMAGS